MLVIAASEMHVTEQRSAGRKHGHHEVGPFDKLDHFSL